MAKREPELWEKIDKLRKVTPKPGTTEALLISIIFDLYAQVQANSESTNRLYRGVDDD
jgi:hypothetical protein